MENINYNEDRNLAGISEAMVELARNSNFAVFIEAIKAQREVVIEDLCSDEVVKNERATLVAIGELRTYKSILATYSELIARKEF
jgi:ferric iron reductase protein FhuF